MSADTSWNAWTGNVTGRNDGVGFCAYAPEPSNNWPPCSKCDQHSQVSNKLQIWLVRPLQTYHFAIIATMDSCHDLLVQGKWNHDSDPIEEDATCVIQVETNNPNAFSANGHWSLWSDQPRSSSWRASWRGGRCCCSIFRAGCRQWYDTLQHCVNLFLAALCGILLRKHEMALDLMYQCINVSTY